MSKRTAEIGDVVLFGRGGTSTGQLTMGKIVEKRGKGKIMVSPFSPRGSPAKPIGARWSMPGSIIQHNFGSIGHMYGIPFAGRSGIPTESIMASAKCLMLGGVEINAEKIRRKNKRTAWRDHLTIEKGDLFTLNNNRNRLYKLTRINQTSLSVEVYNKDSEGEFKDKHSMITKVSVHSNTVLVAHKVGSPQCPFVLAGDDIPTLKSDPILSYGGGVSAPDPSICK